MSNTNELKRAQAFFRDKLAFTTGVAEVSGQLAGGAQVNVVDVRAAKDYEAGHVPGAINLPRERWDSLEGLSSDRPNVVYCYSQTCHLAAKAALEFVSRGFPTVEMEGGFATWSESGKPIERGATAAAE